MRNGKTSPLKENTTAEGQMFEKRSELIASRERKLAELRDIDHDLQALDTVMAIFNPSHVPLDLRPGHFGAPFIEVVPTRQPMLADHSATKETVIKDIVTPVTKKATRVKRVAPAPVAAKPEARVSSKPAKTAKPVKDKTAKPSKITEEAKAAAASVQEQAKAATPVQTPAPIPASALETAIAAKAKGKRKQKTPEEKAASPLAVARDRVSEHFKQVDKLGALEEIIRSSGEGIQLRDIVDAFDNKYPLLKNDDDKELRVALSNRISSILNGLMKQGVIKKADGGLWANARGVRGANHNSAEMQGEAA